MGAGGAAALLRLFRGSMPELPVVCGTVFIAAWACLAWKRFPGLRETARAADGDAFEASNLNRQLLSSPSSLGQSKAETAAARAALVNPDVRFEAIPEFVTEENAGRLIRGCDAVLDALANAAAFIP